MGVIHWIHFSDLHYNKVGTQTDTMREELPSYLSDMAADNKFDYVFFTGDMRFAPKKTYLDETATYFSELCASAGITNERLFVVIGNHDVDRLDTIRLEAISELEGCYYPNDSVIEDELCERLKAGREEYYNLLKKIVSKEQFSEHIDPHKLHFTYTTEDINIVHIDSTLMYSKSKQSDFYIGSYALKMALKQCDKTKPTIILSHYSLDCFEQVEQKAILHLLKSYNVQMWFAGHKHTDIVYKDRDYFYVAHSGNQTFEKLTSPGFVEGFLNLDSGEGTFRVHKWNESSGWAVYQTLIDKTDRKDESQHIDRTQYPFVLDHWLRANGRALPERSSLLDQVSSFIHNYKGKTFFLDTAVSELQLDRKLLLNTLDLLYDKGLIKPINIQKSHWEILK